MKWCDNVNLDYAEKDPYSGSIAVARHLRPVAWAGEEENKATV